jgi:uncharacterized protein YbaR (Trm112 family)
VSENADGPAIDEQLLAILRCPACHGTFVEPDEGPAEMTCSACGRRYPVRSGIPILLVDEARLPEG